MDLVLWRHAEAFEPAGSAADLERALTPKGERQAAAVAAWLQQHLPRATRVLLSDVLVIAMGDTALTPGDGRTQPEQPAQGSQSRPTFLVTLALSPVDANRLVHGIRTGALYAGLRGADTTIDPGLQITDFNVFEVTQ